MSTLPRGPRKDGEATRSRILDAAGELFAEIGYAETTNKAVAERAEVDLASINYHFGSRNGLYQAVLGEAHRSFVDLDELRRLADSPTSSEAKLRGLIELLVERALSRRGGWQLRVLAAEIMTPSSHLHVLIQAQRQPKLSLLRALFSEITGIPEDAPALTRCILSVASPSVMLLIGGRGGRGLVQEIVEMPRAEVADHLYRFALAGLGAISAQQAERQR